MNNNIATNSFRAWLLAARPQTLTGASVSVIIGTVLALSDSEYSIRIIPAVLCFLFAFVMQIDANFVNDYFDFVHGNDDETRLGPRRACAQGWITLKAMRIGLIITTVIACIIGMPLILFGGWSMIIIGLLCVVFCFLYTTTFSYLGLGDVLVLLFFGIVPLSLTYYLEMPEFSQVVTAEVLISSVACGFVIDTLLVVNNFRDIDNDRKAGKKTLVVRVGEDKALMIYLMLGIIACVLGLIHVLNGKIWGFIIPLIYLFFHIRTYMQMKEIRKGKALNMILGKTARNMFIYGLLNAIGLLIP